MKFLMAKINNNVHLDLVPETQAEIFQLESIKDSCEEFKVIHKEDRQWRIESLRLFLPFELPETK